MQGFNMGRYVPPDVEGTTTGNKLHKKKPPGFSRDGAQQTVRFEMPFAVWCGHCAQPTLIGQGVRFNAVKRKVGSHHSTPIFSFAMRHADCGGALEIRTDPANTTYLVVEGGRRRDTGEESGLGMGMEPILTDAEREALRTNAFAKLEKTIADRKALDDARLRIDELARESARKWDDPYERNRRLRAAFRIGRHERERDAKSTEDLRERMSLGIDIVPANDEDGRRAALVDFGMPTEDEMGQKALAKPLFATSGDSNNNNNNNNNNNSNNNNNNSGDGRKRGHSKETKPAKRLKSEAAAAQMRENLVSEIVGNTRAAQDPFLASLADRNSGEAGSGNGGKGPPRILGIKRKRAVEMGTETETETGEQGGGGGGGGGGTEVGTEASRDGNEKDTGVGIVAASAASSSSAAAAAGTALVEYDSD
ncbi:DUF455 domain protein [Hypoxylon fragiforme]|uniref:DUF455 domain protein n=1 Tax=Hypoxylon fragiforme TaxID=63214 RepID=UPI0020C6AECE|nr:DUF455 domain protein [Hypoxylon fragiforme]KAI2609949.1 DUF455 domain protein [Hypoxylon fragiforme]